MDDQIKKVGEKLLLHGQRAEKHIVYGRCFRDMAAFYQLLKIELGSKFTNYGGFMNLSKCLLVDMDTCVTLCHT